MLCPSCKNPFAKVTRHGFFTRQFAGKTIKIARFYCAACRKTFSTQTGTLAYRERRAEADKPIFFSLCSGVSQRRTALLCRVNRKTVGKKLSRLGTFARIYLEACTAASGLTDTIVFDEMETFEHSKCKPLSIALAVDASRRVIAAEVASMPAKGKLASLARRRYGYRPDHRRGALRRVMSAIKRSYGAVKVIRSDQCPRYPALVKEAFPEAMHQRFKGRRGCVVGQGELKAGGFDPLFALNHTCAMFRDNLKTLSRRTWCTTKRPDRLQNLVHLYAVFHNATLDQQCPHLLISG